STMSALSSTLSTLAKRSLPVTSEFNELVRGIGESKSKGEEDAIVQRMVELCRSKIKSGRRDLRASKDFLIYLIYIDMLGHDTRWGHATVIQLCSEKHLVVKKAAYLAASLLLPPGSELGLMLTATILADLASDNWLVVATALQAACRGATPELVTAFLPSVTALLAHPAPGVARKALLALHRFLQLDPGAGADLERTLVERLGHREPALMAAALAGLGQLIRAEPGQYGALAPYLTAILKQAYEGKLGRAFELHRAPAPFLQSTMSALSSTLSTLAKRSLPVTSEFNELVRGIGESKSKGEEDAIVQRMVELCRSKIKSGRRDLRASKDFLIYLIYIDMLGHDTRWGHATVIQLCSEKHLVVKKVDLFFGGGAVGLESVSHQPEREQQQTPLNAPSDPFAMLEGLQTSGQSAPVQDYDPFGGAFLGPTPVASAADGARPPPGLASPSPATSSPNWNLGGVGMRAMAGGAMQKAQSPPPAKKAADPFADLLG
ncbi:hypothetical protein APUTEX25_001260, partial [Auxenochlorella protothecoides]